MKIFRVVIASLFAMLMVVGCGGGGGSSGGSSGGSTDGSTDGSTSDSPSISVTVVNDADTEVDNISVGSSYFAKAVVRDANGNFARGQLVTFSVSGAAIATLNPITAATDANGVAKVSVTPASLTSVGAASIGAGTSVDGVAASDAVVFSVAKPDLALSSITVGSANLPSSGNTSISVTALVAGVPSTGLPVAVVFKASCGRINGLDATGAGVSVSTDGAGVAASTYSSVSILGVPCSDVVTLTAESAGAASKTTLINVAAPVADAINFVVATPSQIYVKGSGASEQSQVSFKVLSSAGAALPNVDVSMSITANPGGVGIESSSSTADVTKKTDENGIVSVSVFSGTIPGPVKLKATLVSNSAVFVETQNLTVASGLPSQNRISLSVDTYNIEGGQYDGAVAKITARIADRQGNAVADGTVINFTAEGGQVAYSCTTQQVERISSCSVNFVSQSPRPSNGRVSVLAFLSGAKDYVDVNGNNVFDAGVDVLTNMGDAYRDDDEDYSFDAGEFVLPRGGSGVCPSGVYPYPAKADTCNDQLATTVRQQTVILLSSTNSTATWVSTSSVASATIDGVTQTVPVITSYVFKVASWQYTQLPMPAGTIVEVSATDQTPGDGLGCVVSRSVNNTPVPNIPPGSAPTDLSTSHTVLLSGCRPADSVFLRVTPPSGTAREFRVQ